MSSTVTKPAALAAHRRRDPLVRRSLPYVVTTVLVMLFCGYEFDLFHRDLRLPMRAPTGDYLFSATVVKGVMQHGWYTTNPMVGAPHGLDFHDFPMAEGLHFIFYQVAGILHLPVVLAMNLHYLLGYVLISLTSLYVFLAYGLPRAPSMAASLLFAFMPHHWMPGQAHLMLSSYYMIPLTVLVVLWLAEGEEFLQHEPGAKWFHWRLTRKGFSAAVICALTGSAGIYYAVFAVGFLALMTAYRLVRFPNLAQALTGLAPIGIIASFVIVNTSPSIIYWLRNGTNHAAAVRSPLEAVVYSLKIAQLLMPISEHRIPLLAHLKSEYLTFTNPYVPNNDLTVALGVVAGFGFLILIAWLLFGCGDTIRPGELLTHLSLLNIAAVLTATIGGFGSIFAMLVSPEIRVYSRISIYIAFFSLFGLLAAVRRFEAPWFSSKNCTRLLHAVVAAVMFAGLWDITPATLAAPPEVRATVENDRNFIHSIESAVPRGSMIYQLPYQPFPENGPTNRMQDYDHFRGYLYSDHLRWSYGAMKGRPADAWERQVASLPVAQMLTTVAEAGFEGLYIDRYGYADAAEQLRGQLDVLLGETPLRSADRRFLFYPLTEYASAIKSVSARAEALQLPAEVFWKGCSQSEGERNFWCASNAELEIDNPGSSARPIHVEATFQSATGAPATLDFGAPVSRTIGIAGGGQPFDFDVQAQPGRTRVRLHSGARRLLSPGDPRVMVFAVLNLEISGAGGFPQKRSPIAASFNGCTPPSGGRNFWCPFDGTLELMNSGREIRHIRISADFQTGANDPGVLTLGGLITRTFPINHTGVPFAADVDLPPGKHVISLHCDGKRYMVPTDSRVLVFSILNLDVTDE